MVQKLLSKLDFKPLQLKCQFCIVLLCFESNNTEILQFLFTLPLHLKAHIWAAEGCEFQTCLQGQMSIFSLEKPLLLKKIPVKVSKI